MILGHTIKIFLVLAALLATLAQILIEPSAQNIACSCLVLASTMAIVLYFSWTKTLETHPLSAFVIFGYCVTTQLGALFAQTIAWTPLTSLLYDPLYTFGTLAFYQAIAMLVHAVYRHFSSTSDSTKSYGRELMRALGVYRTPSAGTLWIMGWIGLTSYFLTKGDDLLSRIASAGNFLTWAPFLIPYYLLQEGHTYCDSRKMTSLLVLHGLLIAVVGIAVNVRNTMFAGITTVSLLYLLHGLRSSKQIKAPTLAKFAALVVIVALLMQPLSDLVFSMVAARTVRGKVSAAEMIENTIYIFQRPDLIKAIKASQVKDLLTSYDETYIANPMLARLTETKFHDNALHFAREIVTDEDKARMQQVTVNSCWAALPSPILKIIGINLIKTDLKFSTGDYLAYLTTGQPLGAFRTGSVFAEGLVVFGYMFPFVYAFGCFILFYLFDLLTTRVSAGRVVISAAAMMSIWHFFLHGITADSIGILFTFIVREFPQFVLTYVLALGASRLLLGKKYAVD